MVAREIDVTEEEVLEANLRALGVEPRSALRDLDEIVFEKLVELTRERKDLVPAADVARAVGRIPSTVQHVLYRLQRANRVIPVEIGRGRNRWVPVVVGREEK